ncbi:MAG: chemotaxis response regulator protein-glutamate methylesterase [Lachnospiraceae bacterium]
MKKNIKIMVVDDSIVFRKLLIDGLSKNDNFTVVGYAINAFDAKRKIDTLHPDVITLDVEMPGMSGIEFLKQLIPTKPIPVILVSSLNLSVFDALSAGAIDFVRKPDPEKSFSVNSFLTALASKIMVASTAKVGASIKSAPPVPIVAPTTRHSASSSRLDSTIIAIGASTGGTEATLQVLRDLPADTPGIVVTQHMPEGFTKMYADRLDRLCHMHVKEAVNGDPIVQGQVLIAPGNLQMEVVKTGTRFTVKCFTGEKVSGHMPSVDVLFTSMAKTAKNNAVGIIMTGMGRDGASGLLEMRKSGAYTIGQDKDSCVVYGMPMVAQEIGGVCIQAACNNIARVLQNHLNKL